MRFTVEAAISVITLCGTILTASGMLVQRLTRLEVLLGEHIKQVEKWLNSLEARVIVLEHGDREEHKR